MVGSNGDEENRMAEEGDEANEDQALVRAGYRSLMDDITNNEDELGDVSGQCQGRLREYMVANEQLFEQVAAPQEAVLDARVLKQLSRLCRTQAEQMSANITQFNQQEFAEKLMANMGGGGISGRKWVLLGTQVKTMFKRSPCLTYLYGALDTTPPPPKARKEREVRATQATRVKDLVATKDTIMQEAEASDNQTEQLVKHVFKCLVAAWKQGGKAPVNFFRFVIDPESFGATIENLFHVSFLVKEGKVNVSVDEGLGLPVIEPVTRQAAGGGSAEERKNQVVMNICMEDWQKLKESLEVKRALIPRMQS